MMGQMCRGQLAGALSPVNHTGPEEQRSEMTECKVLSTNHQCAGDLTVNNYEDNEAVFQKRSERKRYKELLKYARLQ